MTTKVGSLEVLLKVVTDQFNRDIDATRKKMESFGKEAERVVEKARKDFSSSLMKPEVTASELKKVTSAYNRAYREIGAGSKVLVDSQITRYASERDAFIKLTGDKTTANAVFESKIRKLAEAQSALADTSGLQKYSKAIDSAISGFDRFLKLGTAAFAGMGVVGLGTATGFEQTMATVRGVMQATDSEFKLLEQAARKAGETTEWSANESAVALKNMGQAGFSAQQAITALPKLLTLATAGELDLGAASDIAVSSLNAMGLKVDDLGRLNDVLAGTANRTATDISMLGETFKYVAPVASGLGYDLEQLAAMAGILANSGIKASDAGTDLRQAMIQNQRAAKELGTAGGDLIGTLKAARAAGWDVNQITDAYGMIASKSVLVLMKQIGEYERLETQLKNVKGESEKLAKIKADTTIAAFKMLLSVMEDVAIASHDILKGGLKEWLKELANYVRENKSKFAELAQGTLEFGVAMNNAGTVVGGLLKTTLDGWNSLPTTVQQSGLLLALVGGAKARLAIVALTEFAGALKQVYNEIERGGSQFVIPENLNNGGLTEASKQLDELKKKKDDFSKMGTIDKFVLGANYPEKLDAAIEKVNRQVQGYQNLANMRKKALEAKESSKDTGTGNDQKPSFTPPEVPASKTPAKEIAQLYSSAFSTIGAKSKVVYDQMVAQYAKERDAFITATGDKVTAQAVFEKKVADLSRDKEGGKAQKTAGQAAKKSAAEAKKAAREREQAEKEAQRAAEQAARDIENSYSTAYSTIGVVNQTIYDQILARYQRDRDDFIKATGDKKTAELIFQQEKKELDKKFAEDSVSPEKKALKEKLNAYADYYSKTGVMTQGAYDSYIAQYGKDRDDFIKATNDKAAAWKAFYERVRNLNPYVGSDIKKIEVQPEKWTDGIKKGLDDFQMYAGTTADLVSHTVQDAFGGMEDALVGFVSTGKMEFSDLANSIIADLARIAIRQSITQPLMDGAKAVKWGEIGTTLASYFHSGGEVTRSGAVQAFPASWFAGAPRFHEGVNLKNDEIPAILQTGERVLSRKQNASYEKAVMGGGTVVQPVVNITVKEAPGTKATVEQSTAPDGSLNLNVIIEQVENSISGRISRGAGMATFLDARYHRKYS